MEACPIVAAWPAELGTSGAGKGEALEANIAMIDVMFDYSDIGDGGDAADVQIEG